MVQVLMLIIMRLVHKKNVFWTLLRHQNDEAMLYDGLLWDTTFNKIDKIYCF